VKNFISSIFTKHSFGILSKMPQPSVGSSNLRNLTSFPPFSALPGDDGRWCYLGEIEDYAGFIRLVLETRDRDGKGATVALYTPDSGKSLQNSCKKGYTVAVLDAHQHSFLDGRHGVRVEDDESIKVGSCPG
jgi:hypothetical protein